MSGHGRSRGIRSRIVVGGSRGFPCVPRSLWWGPWAPKGPKNDPGGLLGPLAPLGPYWALCGALWGPNEECRVGPWPYGALCRRR